MGGGDAGAREVAPSEIAEGDQKTSSLSPVRQGIARVSAWQGWVNSLAILLLLSTLSLRLIRIDQPEGGLIFDETFYVNAARAILGLPMPSDAPYAGAAVGIDPNSEQLPLAKVIIAGSMKLFGDNPIGWRLPSVLFGTLAVGVLFLLVRRLSNRPWLALLAAFIFSFDNLVFVHGRIATIDINVVTLMLLGIYAYYRGNPLIAGVSVALSTLMGLTGALGIGVIVAFEGLRFGLQPERRRGLPRVAADLLVLCGTFSAVFLGLLGILDHYFTYFPGPLDHLSSIVTHQSALSKAGDAQGIASSPWQWLLNERPINYVKVDVNTSVDGKVVASRTIIHFIGQMNPFVIAMLPFALAYLAWSMVRRRDDLSMLMLALFAVAYLQPVVAATFFHQVSYIYFFLPVLPALCSGVAYFLADKRLPRTLPVSYMVGVLLGFIALFPFRTLL